MAQSVGRVGGSLFSKKAAAQSQYHREHAQKESIHYPPQTARMVTQPSITFVTTPSFMPLGPSHFMLTSSSTLDIAGLVIIITFIILFGSFRRRD